MRKDNLNEQWMNRFGVNFNKKKSELKPLKLWLKFFRPGASNPSWSLGRRSAFSHILGRNLSKT
jgi:hypothetical protein